MACFYLSLLLGINVFTLNAHEYHENSHRSLREAGIKEENAEGSAQMKEDTGILHRLRRDTNQTKEELKPTTEAQLKSKKEEEVKSVKMESRQNNKTGEQQNLNKTEGELKTTTEFVPITSSEEDRLIVKKWAELTATRKPKTDEKGRRTNKVKPKKQRRSKRKDQRTLNKTEQQLTLNKTEKQPILNKTEEQPILNKIEEQSILNQTEEELERKKFEDLTKQAEELKAEIDIVTKVKEEAKLKEQKAKKEAEIKAKKEEEIKAKMKVALKRNKFFLNPRKEKELRNKIDGVKEEKEKPIKKKKVEPKKEEDLKTKEEDKVNQTDPHKYSWSTIKLLSQENPKSAFKFRSAMERQMQTLHNKGDLVNLEKLTAKFKKAFHAQDKFHKVMSEASNKGRPVVFTTDQLRHYRNVVKMKDYVKRMKDKGVSEQVAQNRAADKMLEYWFKVVEETETETSTVTKPETSTVTKQETSTIPKG